MVAQDTEFSYPASVRSYSKNWKENSFPLLKAGLPAGAENAPSSHKNKQTNNCMHCFFAALKLQHPFIIQGLVGEA